MNTIHAFITSLSVKHNNEDVHLNVQHLNDIFFGAKMEQQLLHRNLPSAIPAFLAIPVQEKPFPGEEHEGDDRIYVY